MNEQNKAAKFLRYLSFDHLIAPVLIKIIYWVGVIAILAGGIGAFINAIHTSEKSAMAGSLSIGAILLCLVLWRLVNELWILAFNIYARLVEIRDLLANGRTHSDMKNFASGITRLKR
jgi:uncharacterized membrane protein